MATKDDKPKGASEEVGRWLRTIKAYDTEFAKWEKRVEKILKRYRAESSITNRDNPPSHFPILWSNVQTLVPATFARLPKPDVSRRFSDRDPVGRVAALILERSLDFEVQHYADYRATMRECVFDRFLGGRGSAWQRYEPHVKAQALQEPVDGTQVSEDENEPAGTEVLDYECAPVDYVHWKDFGHTVARTWEEVTAVWRCVYMTREAMENRFGAKKAKEIPLDASPEELKRSDRENPELADQKRAAIYEIWDKTTKKAIWLSKSMKEIIDEKDDPLELEEFFPCPPPLYATLTNETLVPVPDFALYQDQANELDLLADKIDGLVKALEVKGVYDASQGVEIARLFTDAGNTGLRPIKNWQSFAEKNGLKGAIDLVDLQPIAAALQTAYEAMAQAKEQVYEITGISDIIRGQTKASETATAQQIKGQYAGLRLRDMQQGVALFATNLLRLKAQVVAKFDPQTLAAIAAVEQLNPQDQQYVQPAMQLIADRPLRNFRVEISADSLVQIDEQEEKEQAVELLTGMGAFLETAAKVAIPQLMPMIGELLKFAVARFKVGRSIEGVIDQAMEQLQQQQGQQRPDPEMAKIQAQQQADAQRLQFDQQKAQAELQADAQREQMKVQSDEKIALYKADLEHRARMHEVQTHAVAGEMQHRREMEHKARETEGKLGLESNDSMAAAMQQFAQAMQEFAQAQEQLSQALGADKQIVRDPSSGRALGVRVVK